MFSCLQCCPLRETKYEQGHSNVGELKKRQRPGGIAMQLIVQSELPDLHLSRPGIRTSSGRTGLWRAKRLCGQALPLQSSSAPDQRPGANPFPSAEERICPEHPADQTVRKGPGRGILPCFPSKRRAYGVSVRLACRSFGKVPR
jgi:transposase InsO family protein